MVARPPLPASPSSLPPPHAHSQLPTTQLARSGRCRGDGQLAAGPVPAGTPGKSSDPLPPRPLLKVSALWDDAGGTPSGPPAAPLVPPTEPNPAESLTVYEDVSHLRTRSGHVRQPAGSLHQSVRNSLSGGWPLQAGDTGTQLPSQSGPSPHLPLPRHPSSGCGQEEGSGARRPRGASGCRAVPAETPVVPLPSFPEAPNNRDPLVCRV